MKTFAILAVAMLVLTVMPMVLATDVGTGVGINVVTQQFTPRIWMCGERVTYDDNTQNGKNGDLLSERVHNYAFEGEQIGWTVLVMDKNKVEQITDVVGTIGSTQGAGNDVEVECVRSARTIDPFRECNARIDQFQVSWNEDVMAVYDCTFTVETANSMHGEYFLTVEAMDSTGLSGTMVENEYWFLNPTIALSVDGDLTFEEVMPGTLAYSNTLRVGNDAEPGSGVILDMFISGTDFYDPSASGARCPDTNKLSLEHLTYFVTNGAYDSRDLTFSPEVDDFGYTSIPYGTEISAAKRIMRWNTAVRGGPTQGTGSSVTHQDWEEGNALSPGSEMALTFRLDMPEPCSGDFSDGQIYFWGEAI